MTGLSLSHSDFDAFLAVFVGGQMLDAVTTIVILTGGGRETNPLLSVLLGGGYLAFVAGKLALASAVGLGSYFVYGKARAYFLATVLVVILLTYLGAFSNLFQIGLRMLV